MKRLMILSLIIVFMLWFAGCEKQATSSLVSNEAEINEMIADDNEEFFEDDFGFIDSENSGDEGSFAELGKTDAFAKSTTDLLDVWRFGRIVNRDSLYRTVDIHVEGDTAFVQVETKLQGRFVILEKIGEAGDTLVRHRKALKHTIKKNAVYVKRNQDDKHKRRWKLHELSGAVGNSPENTVSIIEIKVVSALTGNEYIFTNPLNSMYQIPDDLPIFPRGDEVTVTVTVENNSANPVELEDGSTETVLLHHGMRPGMRRSRSPLVYIGNDEYENKQYENTWTVNRPALFSYHGVIDVIDNGTIFMADAENYPYNSMTWGFPYRVHRAND